ncbi:NYN domain-containing protein [Candidatus Wolfebacteria bacterium]|nr:NYN domain-containing protein [Candidatus Wolfebacteria bacterium]
MKRLKDFLKKLLKKLVKEVIEESSALTAEKRIVVFIDFENIIKNLEFNISIDFKKLRSMLLEIGNIDFVNVYIPSHLIGYDEMLREFDDFGCRFIYCPKSAVKTDTIKLEDTVDIHMIKDAQYFAQFKEITGLVIMSADKHMVHCVNAFKNDGKIVHVWTSGNISPSLKATSDIFGKVPIKK